MMIRVKQKQKHFKLKHIDTIKMKQRKSEEREEKLKFSYREIKKLPAMFIIPAARNFNQSK